MRGSAELGDQGSHPITFAEQPRGESGFTLDDSLSGIPWTRVLLYTTGCFFIENFFLSFFLF